MATAKQLELEAETIERFRRDLDAHVALDAPVGRRRVGRPRQPRASVARRRSPAGRWSRRRPSIMRCGRKAAPRPKLVARICERLGVPHAILTAGWEEKPETAIQERARAMRYRLLGDWARERGLAALLTAHHLDDQAETFLMRLARGAGVGASPGMRRVARMPDGGLAHRPAAARLAPLGARSGLRRSGRRARCRTRATTTDQFERVRVRKALAGSELIDAPQVAAERHAPRRGRCRFAMGGHPRMAARSHGERERDRLSAGRRSARNPPPHRPPRRARARHGGRRRRASRPRARISCSPRFAPGGRPPSAECSAPEGTSGASPRRPLGG